MPAFHITGTNPIPHSYQFEIPEAFYDIIGYIPYSKYLPTSTIKTFVNGITVDSVILEGSTCYDNTLEFIRSGFNEITESVIDLPSDIPWDDADYQLQNPPNTDASGSQAAFYFEWDQPTDQYRIQAIGGGRVKYSVYQYGAYYPFNVWSNEALVNHEINP
jgi:hypothetical protein